MHFRERIRKNEGEDMKDILRSSNIHLLGFTKKKGEKRKNEKEALIILKIATKNFSRNEGGSPQNRKPHHV